MDIEKIKDIKLLQSMRHTAIKHLERLDDIAGFDAIRDDLARIELRIEELELTKKK